MFNQAVQCSMFNVQCSMWVEELLRSFETETRKSCKIIITFNSQNIKHRERIIMIQTLCTVLPYLVQVARSEMFAHNTLHLANL